MQYNEDSILTRDFNLLENGGFNFIVGKMNDHNNQARAFLTNNLDSLIDECLGSGFFFLKESSTDPDSTYGVDVKDEPSIGMAPELLARVQNIKQNDPDRLGFINLLPSYGFNSFSEWKSYANAYLGDTSLQVACFDNYYPNSNFNSNRPPQHGNYYADLTYMKRLAGSRPLWAYLRCSEKYVEEKDSAWQDAYLRIGAFAPLAFGAKGIIYFCYDCIDRNRILRSPGRGSWGNHAIYFDNDEKSRHIFFGNIKRDSMSIYPDLAIHTNDNLGAWRIKETSNTGIETNQNLSLLGTWYGDHNHNMPNIYNWNFTSDGFDKFTTITSAGRLLLSKFRSGWTHYADISNFPTSYWSTMSRHTCPFADFNGNKLFDLCLGWTENGQGKLWVLMDCHLDPAHTLTPRNNPMLFDDTSQIFTFSDPIKQTIARNDTIWVITSNPNRTYETSDSLHILKYSNSQFSTVYTHKITMNKKIDHYWMEETLYGQDDSGGVWGEADGQEFSLTNKITGFSSNLIYVWGQYNNRSHQYDRYGLAADGRSSFQSYALLDRKGIPNRLYYTARAINQFINDSISSLVMDERWLGAYFSSTPNQSVLDSLKIIKGSDQNPLPLVSTGFAMSNAVLFGLYWGEGDDLYLLVINMRETSRNLIFTIDRHAVLHQLDEFYPQIQYTFRCDGITRMASTDNNLTDVYSHYTTVGLNNMLGGECAILHLSIIPNQ